LGPAKELPPVFTVTIVDQHGVPLDDLELGLRVDGARRRMQTDGAGRVHFEGEQSSRASARIARASEARAKLNDHLRQGLEGAPPEPGPDVVTVPLQDDMDEVAVDAGIPKTVILVRPAFRASLVGMYFETNKSFLLPDAMKDIRALVVFYEAHPQSKLLVTGHTDRAGDDQYNLDLSLERADAVAAFLKDDDAAWLAWFGEGKPPEKRWGVREEQYMLSALPHDADEPFYAGPPSGALDAQTQAATRAFQAFCNETRGTSLVVDGLLGPVTRAELVRAYMAIEGTSLPDDDTLTTFGCGELFPAEATEDGVADAENRRVEIFFFEDVIAPPPPGKKATKGSTEYPAWEKQITEQIDFTMAGLGVVVRDEDGDPVADARVVANGPVVSETRTDVKGHAHLFNMADGSYTVTAEADGFVAASGVVVAPVPLPEDAAKKGMTVSTEADGAGEPVAVLTLTAHVALLVPLERDTRSAAEGRATVTLRSEDGAFETNVASDDPAVSLRGDTLLLYPFTAPPGEYSLRVRVGDEDREILRGLVVSRDDVSWRGASLRAFEPGTTLGDPDDEPARVVYEQSDDQRELGCGY
jgi:outer membrane protein OmpA-like peptidoglycan-associated protein